MIQGLFDHFRASNDSDLDVDADLPEVIHGDLVVAEVEELVVLIDGAEANAVRAPRVAGPIQQLFGRLGIIPIVLLDFIGPLLVRHEVPQHRWADRPGRARITPTLHVDLGDGLLVDGQAQGLAHADIAEGPLGDETDRRFRAKGPWV